MPTFSLPCAPSDPRGPTSVLQGTLFYQISSERTEVHCFGGTFCPGTFSAHRCNRPVSCYAFFKGWLLLSKPPGCHCDNTSFEILKSALGTLANDLGCCPLDDGTSLSPSHSCDCERQVFGVCQDSVGLSKPPHRNSSSTPCRMSQGCSEKHFEENQLSPGSISFSLQPTSHPSILRYAMVRTSIPLSWDFILLMGSSPGFGSSPSDKRPIRTRFRSGFG